MLLGAIALIAHGYTACAPCSWLTWVIAPFGDLDQSHMCGRSVWLRFHQEAEIRGVMRSQDAGSPDFVVRESGFPRHYRQGVHLRFGRYPEVMR